MLSHSAIVLLGNFNPAIYQPAWLERYGVLPVQDVQWSEGENLDIEEVPYKNGKIIIKKGPPLIVTSELARLQFPDIGILVDQDKYECSTIFREKFSLVKEVTIKIFSLLNHTPIKAAGINFDGHLKFNENSDLMLKNLFAKQDDIFKKDLEPDYHIGGVIKFTKEGIETTITIENSNRMPDGIYVNVNFHRDIKTMQADEAINWIQESYEPSMAQFIENIKKILGSLSQHGSHNQ